MSISLDSKGTEFTLADAAGHSPVNGKNWGTPIRKAFFSYTVPAGGEADGNNVGVVKGLPKGAILLGGKIAHDGLGNAVDIGLRGTDGSGDYDGSTADDDDFLAAASSVASAGESVFGNTIARNYGYELLKDCDLVLTVETGAWTAAKVVKGHIEYATQQ